MADSAVAKITAQLVSTDTRDLDLADAVDALALDWSQNLAAGSSDGQVNLVWHDERTLAATSENLDLAGGLTNAHGQTITFTSIRMLAIRNVTTTSTYDLTVGGAASNAVTSLFGGATHTVPVKPGGWHIWFSPTDGHTVTGGSADILKLNAGSNSVTYDIIIWGIGTRA